jgi:type IV pilus assembly protein PilV
VSGFTLIEVLIAVLVLAVGLVGLAGIQASGLQMNDSAYMRSQASILAQDIADRARANTRGFRNGAYDDPSADIHDDCQEHANRCTAKEMAQTDVKVWQDSVAALLPDGEGTICQDGNSPDSGSSASSPACNGGEYVVKIWWTDDRSGDLQRFVTEVRPL